MLTQSIPFQYQYFSLEKLRSVVKSCPVAILPTGLLEWHGEQNTLGLDGHSATLAVEHTMIKLGGGAMLPTNWVGTYGWSRMPGCFVFNQETVSRVFYEFYREMIKIGFKICIIITGHWGPYQTQALKEAAQKAQEEFGEKDGISQGIRCLGFRLVDIYPAEDYGHARTMETSIEMAVADTLGLPLVDATLAKKEDQPMHQDLYPPYNPKAPANDPEIFEWNGDVCDPELCNKEKGYRYLEMVSRGLALEILEYFNDLGIDYNPPNLIPDPE